MAYDSNINPGNPPLVWSRIKEAFDKVNQNFTIIGSSLARERKLFVSHIESGTADSNPIRIVTTEMHDLRDNQIVFIFDTGISQLDNRELYVRKESDTEVLLYEDQLLTIPVDGTTYDTYSSGGGNIQGGSEYAGTDFENLATNVSPNAVATFNLGSVTKPWKSLYTAEHADDDANAFNGVWLGSAQIKGKSGGIIDLPLGSTVNGELIINPSQTFFKSVQVDSGNQVVADDFVDTLNLISGTAISMAVDSSAESITITNAGVTQATAGLGISVSSGTGNVTVTNSGVRSIQSTTALPSGRTEGAGINVDNSTGDNVKITNTGVLEIQPGSAALTVFTDDATGIVTITNAAPAGNAYRTIDVGGTGTTLVTAPTIAGTLKVLEGNGITLSGNDGLQTLEIAFSGKADITGSVFSDDSTLLVNAVDGNIPWSVIANAPSFLTSVAFGDLTSTPTTLAGYGITDAATSAQGALADTAVQPGDALTGTLDGDITGSVFADDSTLLIDGVDGKIVGPIESDNIRGTLIGTVYADDSTEIIDAEGTVLGTIAPGAAAPSSETEAAPIGEIRVDDNYVYVRKSTGWGRISIGGWV